MVYSMKKTELPKNNKVCLLPWRGAHIMPDGDVVPCCHQTFGHYGKKDFDVKLSLKDGDIGSIRGGVQWDKLRKDLINGVENEACEYCWRHERRNLPSMRTQKNKTHSHILNDIEFNEDGTLDKHEIRYWDIRDSNLCNMKCVMCGPGLSSLWNEEAIKNWNPKEPNRYDIKHPQGDKAVFHVNDVSREPIESIIERHIDHADTFYFAGGEPLINPTHWRILEMLVERKMFHVKLFYNTNLLKLKYGKWDAIKMWENFPEVHIGASIDAVGPRAEYSRTGTVWSQIDKNFKEVHAQRPKHAGISATMNIMTIGGMPELMDWIGERQVYKNKFIYHNVLVSPNYLNINILPMHMREAYWQKIEDKVNTWDPEWRYVISGHSYDVLKERMLNDIIPDTRQELERNRFKRMIMQLDRVRGTNILEACPDLKEFWDSIKI